VRPEELQKISLTKQLTG